MMEYDELNFAMRQGILAQGRGDAGRRFPEVSTIGNVAVCSPTV